MNIKKKITKIRTKLLRCILPESFFVFMIRRNLIEQKSARPMPGRVVLVCPSLRLGGAERQVVNTLNGIGKDCVESLTLLCDDLDNHSGENYIHLARQSGWPVRTIRTDWNKKISGGAAKCIGFIVNSISKNLGADVINLYHEFCELRPQVVHAWLDWSNARAGLAAVLAGVPRVILSGRNVSPRHFELNTHYYRLVYKALLDCDHAGVVLLNNSQAGADDYADWLSVASDRLVVVRNGVDFRHEMRPSLSETGALRKKLAIPNDAKIIGGMFRLELEKDPYLWIETAKCCIRIDKNVLFIMFGDGAIRANIEAKIAEYGLQARVKLYGNIVPAINGLSLCDAVLLTSLKEGTPNVLLESQWLAIPVVTTEAGGAAEAVWDGVTGIVVHSRNPELIASALKRCMFDREFIAVVKDRAPGFVEQKYGIDCMIRETLAVYNLPGHTELKGSGNNG